MPLPPPIERRPSGPGLLIDRLRQSGLAACLASAGLGAALGLIGSAGLMFVLAR